MGLAHAYQFSLFHSAIQYKMYNYVGDFTKNFSVSKNATLLARRRPSNTSQDVRAIMKLQPSSRLDRSADLSKVIMFARATQYYVNDV